jgi:outer membrane protein assembly factor BamB
MFCPKQNGYRGEDVELRSARLLRWIAMYALNATTGKLLWRTQLNQLEVIVQPTTMAKYTMVQQAHILSVSMERRVKFYGLQNREAEIGSLMV